LTCTKIALKVAGFFYIKKLGQFEVLVNVWACGFRHVGHVRPIRGTPQKWAPTRGAANFLHAGNNGRHPIEGVKWIKATVMTKKGHQFF